jgi:hypothetical protein
MKQYAHISTWDLQGSLYLLPICGSKKGHRLEGQKDINSQDIIHRSDIDDEWLKTNVDCKQCLDLYLKPTKEESTQLSLF